MREMKDSGIEWIGEIPKDWETGKTLYALSMPITDGPHETPELFDEGIPFVSAEAVSCGNGHIDFEHIRGFISQEFYDECCKKYIPQLNDVYMIKSGATTGKVAKVETDKIFTIWSPLAVFRVDDSKYYYEYLYYFIQSDGYQKQIENKWTYGTQQNIGMRTLEKLFVCFPPLTEQRKIADYLDAKCSQIDTIIAKQQVIIEKLKEYKLSVITEAVTKGIISDVEMKDSGITWVGSIPDTWSIKPLFTLFYEGKNKNRDGVEQNLLSLSYGNIVRKDIKSTDGLLPDNFNNYKIIDDGDIIIRPTDLQNDKRSLRTGLAKEHGIITSAYIDLKPRENVNSMYFHYLLHCYDIMKVFYNMGNGVRQGLNYSEFSKLPLVIPSVNEQKEIVEYLDRKTKLIDSVINMKTEKVNKLICYKKSLIYEVVTGKKEV